MDKRTIIFAALAFVVMMNIASFALMGHDKRCARLNSRRGSKSGKGWTPDGSNRRFEAQRRRQGLRRVPEKRLFLVTACFGGLGGVLGMTLCRHKTKHWYFRVFFPLFLIAQIAALAWACAAWLK